MILLADRVSGAASGQKFLGGMDITVSRNYFGSQVASNVVRMDLTESFNAELALLTPLSEGDPCGVFIRAPAILAVGLLAEALAWVQLPGANSVEMNDSSHPSRVCVAARQGPLLATAFHPELTHQRCFHRLFLRMIADASVGVLSDVPSECDSAVEVDERHKCQGIAGAPSFTLASIALPTTIVGPGTADTLTPGTSPASSYRGR